MNSRSRKYLAAGALSVISFVGTSVWGVAEVTAQGRGGGGACQSSGGNRPSGSSMSRGVPGGGYPSPISSGFNNGYGYPAISAQQLRALQAQSVMLEQAMWQLNQQQLQLANAQRQQELAAKKAEQVKLAKEKREAKEKKKADEKKARAEKVEGQIAAAEKK